MSVLLAAKINNLVVMGSDSRLYDVTATRLIGDNGRKITEIAPGVFFGWAGFSGSEREFVKPLNLTGVLRKRCFGLNSEVA